MAVELRCPECKAKLRLARAPEPDSEIECSKCGFVFPTDDHIVRSGGEDEDDRPKRKKRDDEDDGDEEAPKRKAAANAEKPSPNANKPKPPDVPFKRKKRRAKKKKTNPYVMWSIIGGSLMILGIVAGVLLWMMSKKTSSQEMMSYLPDECDEVSGLNLAHMSKYPEFFKVAEQQFYTKGFSKAADAFAKVLGSNASYNVLEYVLQAEGKSGGKPDGTPVQATVFRTRGDFDTSLLNKMPGAHEFAAEGIKYYTVDDVGLGYPGLRVFAPTSRLVVFCRGDMPEAKFKAMLTGNKANPDATVYKRCGPLFKKVTRGTAWKFTLYGRSMPKPGPPAAPAASGSGESDEDALTKEIADMLSSAQGAGLKASLGSRDIRGEWVIWYKDSDSASSMKKKCKEKDWIKDDEKDPPRWWRSVAAKSGGGKTAPNALRDGLHFDASGEVFSVRTSLETKTVQSGLGTLMNALFGQQQSGPGGPVGLGGGGGPVGVGGGGGGGKAPNPPAPPGPGQPPGKRRRFGVRVARKF